MRAAAAAVALVLALAGCGGDDQAAEPRGGDAPAPRAGDERGTSERTEPAGPGRDTSDRTERAGPESGEGGWARPRVRRARCPKELANCATATGRVLYVEAVDPDGDGDAHYVLLGGSVTFPGISVIDVGPALRPRRLPRKGEWVSAAGPVYRGSYGQRQIEAVVVHHER